MAFNTAIKSSLNGPSVAYGFWLTFPSAALAKSILHGDSGSSTKFSWVLVDAEHGLISDHHYYELNNAIGSENVSPIIRVPCAEEWMIKRALDAGAHGIMTPMCHSEVDAANIVKWTKYPPRGTRGYGPMFAPHAFPGLNAGPAYDEGTEGGITIAVQIESKSGVENVEKIAAVPGIDVLFIGPFDLAKQTNVVHGGEEHEGYIKRILHAAHNAGKKAAIFCSNGNDANRRTQQGFDMISVNTDVGVIRTAMLNELKTANGEAVEGGPRKGY
ncbi:hypothetical protein N7468_004776 [Penicillium chermesinum]|uniref:HpcH/HpaI aldolase/citrate lyase domain-containing protein n=1 Tax=Penicillium chermesinum TaxID=63820 RepID=A0A9W9TT24_9EURO|nr:uncharacterized protein N7468_004776 [Penicillium chermesinum]KAJ5240157.1 hypothetical protein N7468_004776 [Penicillium chermesinum]KAJ6167031.1 hypothetical protein N7470_002478 [Penicillium chermesinum]